MSAPSHRPPTQKDIDAQMATDIIDRSPVLRGIMSGLMREVYAGHISNETFALLIKSRMRHALAEFGLGEERSTG